jgi:hypothetical protein
MNWLILNGNPRQSEFDTYLDRLGKGIEGRGHTPVRFDLRDLDLRFCTGCWACWWKTPGLCAIRDDMSLLYPRFAEADMVIWASPLVLGTVSGLLKKVQDRFIPMVHPYIEIVDGEFHHRLRYAHNPDLGLLVEPTEEDTEEDTGEDIKINRALFERFSRNTRTRLRFCATTDTPAEEVIDAALVD